MRPLRIVVLLSFGCCLAAALAGLRVAQVRCVARINQHRMQQLLLERTLHDRHLSLARLRKPGLIRSRVERLGLRVHVPEDREDSGNLNRYASAGHDLP